MYKSSPRGTIIRAWDSRQMCFLLHWDEMLDLGSILSLWHYKVSTSTYCIIVSYLQNTLLFLYLLSIHLKPRYVRLSWGHLISLLYIYSSHPNPITHAAADILTYDKAQHAFSVPSMETSYTLNTNGSKSDMWCEQRQFHLSRVFLTPSLKLLIKRHCFYTLFWGRKHLHYSHFRHPCSCNKYCSKI